MKITKEQLLAYIKEAFRAPPVVRNLKTQDPNWDPRSETRNDEPLQKTPSGRWSNVAPGERLQPEPALSDEPSVRTTTDQPTVGAKRSTKTNNPAIGRASTELAPLKGPATQAESPVQQLEKKVQSIESDVENLQFEVDRLAGGGMKKEEEELEEEIKEENQTMKITEGQLVKLIQESLREIGSRISPLNPINSADVQKYIKDKNPGQQRISPLNPVQATDVQSAVEKERPELEEATPPGYEKIVKGIKKSVRKGDTPKTYDGGKETNPWAIANSMKNKGIEPKKEELSAWDKIQADRKKKAPQIKAQIQKGIRAISPVTVTKEELTHIVREAMKEWEPKRTHGEYAPESEKKSAYLDASKGSETEEEKKKRENEKEDKEYRKKWGLGEAIEEERSQFDVGKGKATVGKPEKDERWKRNVKSSGGENKASVSGMITKEALTKIVREALKENDGSWWENKKKELEEEKALKEGEKLEEVDQEKEEQDMKITKEGLVKLIREEIGKLMTEEPQVAGGPQASGGEEDASENQHEETLKEADSEEDELRSGSNTRQSEDFSEVPPRTLKESKKSVLLAKPKKG